MQLIKLATPHARQSAYYGMGVSYASTDATMSNDGARIESTVGFEFARTGNSRLYLEGNFALPLYDVANSYPIAFVASFGAGL